MVIGFFCCPIVGIIFGYLSIQDARRFGKPATLGWIAIGLSVLSIVLSSTLFFAGYWPRRR